MHSCSRRPLTGTTAAPLLQAWLLCSSAGRTPAASKMDHALQHKYQDTFWPCSAFQVHKHQHAHDALLLPLRGKPGKQNLKPSGLTQLQAAAAQPENAARLRSTDTEFLSVIGLKTRPKSDLCFSTVSHPASHRQHVKPHSMQHNTPDITPERGSAQCLLLQCSQHSSCSTCTAAHIPSPDPKRVPVGVLFSFPLQCLCVSVKQAQDLARQL